MATHGVDKPVLNIFRMFGLMSGQRVAVVTSSGLNAKEIITNGVRGSSDINALAAKDKNALSIMLWNYHDDNIPAPASGVEISVNGLVDGKMLMRQYRVDSSFSKAYEVGDR